jgi:hypothetical protein
MKTIHSLYEAGKEGIAPSEGSVDAMINNLNCYAYSRHLGNIKAERIYWGKSYTGSDKVVFAIFRDYE